MNKKCLILLICLLMQTTAESRVKPRMSQSSQLLSQDAVIENSLRPQETHVFRVLLRSGDYFEAELVERGINVVLDFYDPAGKRLTEEETRTGIFDTWNFEAIAPVSGQFRLELKGASPAPGNYQLTIKALREATEKDQKDVQAHQTEIEAVKLDEQGTVQARRTAIEKAEQVLAYRISSGDRPGEARVRAGLGGIYFLSNDRQKALQYLERALELFRALGDRNNVASVLNNLGAVYQEMGDPEKALGYFMESLPE